MKLPRFFSDECCPQPLVKALRAIGYEVEYVIAGAVGLADVDQACGPNGSKYWLDRCRLPIIDRYRLRQRGL